MSSILMMAMIPLRRDSFLTIWSNSLNLTNRSTIQSAMATNPAAPPRDTRTRRTRSALITAGLELLVERPIDAIAIDELVARAGVAKGSFFNHFRDKHDFAAAVGAEVRLAVEAEVARANDSIADPVARIAGGMGVAARLAVEEPRRMMVLLRTQGGVTAPAHPLNRGLKDDLDAALAAGLLRDEARAAGVTYWLGLCQVTMVHLIETRCTRPEAEALLAQMLVLGLTGLGVAADRADVTARAVLARAFGPV
jgi:AcrR family transcriptional regulator